MTTRRPGFAAFIRFRAPWRPMTFASAASRIAQVLMTTRSAASIAGASATAGGEQAPGHLLGVALVHLAAQRPDEERRQRAHLGPELVEALVGRVERRARAGRAGDRRREVEDGQGIGSSFGRHGSAGVVQAVGGEVGRPDVAGPSRPQRPSATRRPATSSSGITSQAWLSAYGP